MTTFLNDIQQLKQKTKNLVVDFETKINEYLTEFEDIEHFVNELQTTGKIESEILTLQDLSKLLRVHDNTVRRFVSLGKIKARKIGKKLYFLRDELPTMFVENEKGAES